MYGYSLHAERVRSFMIEAGQKVRDLPEMPSMDERRLRARLILEEAVETITSLGFEGPASWQKAVAEFMDFLAKCEYHTLGVTSPVLSMIADGCADLSVVTVGTLIACGIPDSKLFKLVDENNMAKFGPGGHRDANGKWIKPPNHTKPDIEGFFKGLMDDARRDQA